MKAHANAQQSDVNKAGQSTNNPVEANDQYDNWAAMSRLSVEPGKTINPNTESPDRVQLLQRTLGNRATIKLLQREMDKGVIQRDPPTATAPGTDLVRDRGGASLDAREAVSLIRGRLFDSGGYFAAVRSVITQFEEDMSTEVNRYAGDATRSAEARSAARTVADAVIKDAAKQVGKKALTILVQGLSGATVAAGPAGVAAGFLVTIISTILSETNNYDPVVVRTAQKPTHQVYTEGVMDTVNHEHDAARDRLSQQETEMAAQDSLETLQAYANEINNARDRINSSYYLDLTRGYMPLAEQDSVNLPNTPWARWGGTQQQHSYLFGLVGEDIWTERVEGADVFVELRASDLNPANMVVVRTVIPSLPTGVCEQLNDPSMTRGKRFSEIATAGNRLTIEIGGMSYPARMDFVAGQRIEIAQQVSFSEQFFRGVASHVGGDGAHSGAVAVYANVLQRPLHSMRIGT